MGWERWPTLAGPWQPRVILHMAIVDDIPSWAAVAPRAGIGATVAGPRTARSELAALPCT